MVMRSGKDQSSATQLPRLKLAAVLFSLVIVIFIGQLFRLQILRGADYRQQAINSQVKQLRIPANRGVIYASSGSEVVPLVLNERRWTVFADGYYVNDVDRIEAALSEIDIQVSQEQLSRLVDDNNRYTVLGQRLTDSQRQVLLDADLKGVYFQAQPVRAYPNLSMASQVLGFVNFDQQGQYGVEQQYNQQLTGQDGRLKAVTDVAGVPLAFEESNIDVKPVDGMDIFLTLDTAVQSIVEEALEKSVKSTRATGGSVVVLHAETGDVLAMSNYPSFDPASYYEVEDIETYKNPSISEAIEPGSIVKPLVFAAALQEGVVGVNDRYFDPNTVVVQGATVKNSRDYGSQERDVEDILVFSLNTGSIYLLEQLGGGELNQQARQNLYDYYTGNFHLGRATGIDLPNEAAGVVYGPNQGFGLDIRYANMTFGQGLTLTPLQIAAAYGATLNDGELMRPRVVRQIGQEVIEPEVVDSNVVSKKTVEQIRDLFRRMAQRNYADVQVEGLEISGKTGTAQISDGEGGYIKGQFIATFTGYIKSETETIVISIRLDRPQVEQPSLQGSAPMWKEIVRGMINSGVVN